MNKSTDPTDCNLRWTQAFAASLEATGPDAAPTADTLLHRRLKRRRSRNTAVGVFTVAVAVIFIFAWPGSSGWLPRLREPGLAVTPAADRAPRAESQRHTLMARGKAPQLPSTEAPFLVGFDPERPQQRYPLYYDDSGELVQVGYMRPPQSRRIAIYQLHPNDQERLRERWREAGYNTRLDL